MSEAHAAAEPETPIHNDIYDLCQRARTATWKKRTNIPGTNWFWVNSAALPAGFEILENTTNQEIGSVWLSVVGESKILVLHGPGNVGAVHKLDCSHIRLPLGSPSAVVTALIRKLLLEAPKTAHAAEWSELAARNGIALALLFCPETGRWLMDKRSKEVSFSGHWGLPGGAINDGEAPAAAAARELSEEAGVHKARYVRTIEIDDRLWCSVFVVDTEVKPRKSKESSKIEWVSEFPKPLVPAMEEKLSVYRDALRELGAHPPARPTLEAFSPAFKAWFGHSVMVGHDGKPLRMYHGTTYDIPEFKREFVGHGHDQEGSGFYFTSDPDQASGYNEVKPELRGLLAGPNVMPVYLRIQKPVTNKPFTRSQVERIILAGDEDALWNFGDVGYEGKRRVVQQAVNQYADNDWPTIRILFMLANDFYRGEDGKFLEVLQRVTGYDGIVVHHGARTIAVVFSPNQIKSVYNTNPSKKSNLVAGAVVESGVGDNKLLWMREGYLQGCLNGEQDPGGEDALADYFITDQFREAAVDLADRECSAFLEAATSKCADLLSDFVARGSLDTRRRYQDLGSAFWFSANRDSSNAFSAYDSNKYAALHELAQSMFKPKRVRIHGEQGTKQSLDLEPKPEADWGRFNSVTAAAEPPDERTEWHNLKLSTHVNGYLIKVEPDLDGVGDPMLHVSIQSSKGTGLVLSARVITNELRNNKGLGQFFEFVDTYDSNADATKEINSPWVPVPGSALRSKRSVAQWLVPRMLAEMKKTEAGVTAATEPEPDLLSRLENKHLKTSGLDFFFELNPVSEHTDESYVTVDILDKDHEDGLPHLSGRLLLCSSGPNTGKYVFRPFELTPLPVDGNPMWLQGSKGTYTATRYEYVIPDKSSTYAMLRVFTQVYREIVNKFKRGTDMTAATEPETVHHISLFDRASSPEHEREGKRVSLNIHGVVVTLYVTYWARHTASDFKIPADMEQRNGFGLHEFDLLLEKGQNKLWKSFILCLTQDKRHVRIVDSHDKATSNPGFDVQIDGKNMSKVLGHSPLRTDATVPAQDRAILACVVKKALDLFNNVFPGQAQAAAEPNDLLSMESIARTLNRKTISVPTAFGSVEIGYNSYVYAAAHHSLNKGVVTTWFALQPDLNRSNTVEVEATSLSLHSIFESSAGTHLKKNLGDLGYITITNEMNMRSFLAAVIKKVIWLTELVFRDHGIFIVNKRLRTLPYNALQVTQDILRDILDQNPDDPKTISKDGYQVSLISRDKRLPLQDRPWFRVVAPDGDNFLGFFSLEQGRWYPTFWATPDNFDTERVRRERAHLPSVPFQNTEKTTTALMTCALECARSQEPATAAAEPEVKKFTLASFLEHLGNEPFSVWQNRQIKTSVGTITLINLTSPSLTTALLVCEIKHHNVTYTLHLAHTAHKPEGKSYAFACRGRDFPDRTQAAGVYRFNSATEDYDGFKLLQRVFEALLTNPNVQKVIEWKP